MAICVNLSELLLDDVNNQTLSTDDSNVDATVRSIINRIALPGVCVFGIVGNILNLTILTRRKLQKSFRSLEQAANLCLIALAVSDLMFCILAFLFTFVPGDEYEYEGKGFLYFYKMYSTAFINLFIMESTMLTVAMSLERYMAICFPLRQDLYLTTRRIKYIIVGSFLFSLAFNVPVLWRFESHLICPDFRTNISQVLGDSSDSLKYNYNSHTLDSAHWKEGENPLLNKNKSYWFSLTTQGSTTATSSISAPKPSTSSSSLHKNANSIIASSISSLSSATLPKSKSSSISPSSSSSSSLSSSSPSTPDSTSLGDRYHVRKVPLWGSQVYELAYRILWAIIGNFIPLVLLFFFNVCLCRNIYLSYKLRRQFKRQNQAKSSSHILTVTLVVIVVMFFILVAPSEIVLLAGTSPTMESIFNFLQSLNFSLNFILYCIISRHFRKTLKYIFMCGCYNIYQVSRDWKKEFETSLM